MPERQNPVKLPLLAEAGDQSEALARSKLKTMKKLLSMLPCALLVMTGCARYQYAIVEPSHLGRTIGQDGTRITYEPLEYDFAVRDGELSMAIANPAAQPVSIVAEKSYVVSPEGASHPVPVAGSIAPRSFTATLLPPQPPVYRSGPAFSFGFGIGSYSAPFYGGPVVSHSFGYHFYDSVYEGPREHYPANLPNYWTWKTGRVRLRLTYEQGDTNTFSHDFVLERRKVK